ncbi:MAG: DUF4252 domain-containing protein [bacterium]
MKLQKLILILFCLTIFSSALLAQDEEIRKNPGYFDLNNISKMFDEEPTLEINLEGFLLSMAASATKIAEPDLADVLDNLLYVRVERYDLPFDKRKTVQDKNSDLAKNLDKSGWERIVRVRENRDDVYIYLKPDKKNIVGIVVMAVEGSKNVLFANIVGNIDPEQIGRIGSRWDLDHLDSIRWESDRKK